MIAALGWTPADAEPLTLRELVAAHDAYLLDRWDHTASMCALTHNLTVIVSGFGGKSKMTPQTVYDFHPYRKAPKTGLVLTRENFDILRVIGNAMCK